jgi:predicted transcriptional regulator of viral defense system
MARGDVLPRLLEIASEQAGYVTAAQAARFDIPQSRLSRLAGTGDLRRIRWGVYAMRHAQHRLEEEIGAWLSVDRERLPWERNDVAIAVLSHASAAGIHNLGTLIPQYPAITVPPEHRSATQAKAIELHVAPLSPLDWEWVRIEGGRLPVTTAARTIVDLLLAGEERSYVERAIEDALAHERMTPEGILATARRRRKRSVGLANRVASLLETIA